MAAHSAQTPRALDVVPQATLVRGVWTVVLVALVYAVLRALGFHRFFPDDAEGIGAILQIVGTLYSVLYAFAIYVIWGRSLRLRARFSRRPAL